MEQTSNTCIPYQSTTHLSHLSIIKTNDFAADFGMIQKWKSQLETFKAVKNQIVDHFSRLQLRAWRSCLHSGMSRVMLFSPYGVGFELGADNLQKGRLIFF